MKKWLMGLGVGLVVLIMVVLLNANGYGLSDGPEFSLSSLIEGFNGGETSHTVDIPLTTRTPPLCNPKGGGNFCGPSAKCAMTGAQCTSDIDCVGCMPPDVTTTPVLHPYDDAGKASWGMTYSSLVSPWSRDSLDVGPLPALLPPMPYLEEDAFKGKFQGGLA